MNAVSTGPPDNVLFDIHGLAADFAILLLTSTLRPGFVRRPSERLGSRLISCGEFFNISVCCSHSLDFCSRTLESLYCFVVVGAEIFCIIQKHASKNVHVRVGACSLESLYCSCLCILQSQRVLRAHVEVSEIREVGPCPVRGRKEDGGKEMYVKMQICSHRAPV